MTELVDEAFQSCKAFLWTPAQLCFTIGPQPTSGFDRSPLTDQTEQRSRGKMKALDALKAAPPEVRVAALALLDQVSAPLTERQLVAAFRAQGIGILDAKRVARALRKLDIIAVTPRGP